MSYYASLDKPPYNYEEVRAANEIPHFDYEFYSWQLTTFEPTGTFFTMPFGTYTLSLGTEGTNKALSLYKLLDNVVYGNFFTELTIEAGGGLKLTREQKAKYTKFIARGEPTMTIAEFIIINPTDLTIVTGNFGNNKIGANEHFTQTAPPGVLVPE